MSCNMFPANDRITAFSYRKGWVTSKAENVKGQIENLTLIDLWGSEKVTSHSPQKLKVKNFLKNYIAILKERKKYYINEKS